MAITPLEIDSRFLIPLKNPRCAAPQRALQLLRGIWRAKSSDLLPEEIDLLVYA